MVNNECSNLSVAGALPRGKEPPAVHLAYKSGWTLQVAWKGWRQISLPCVQEWVDPTSSLERVATDFSALCTRVGGPYK